MGHNFKILGRYYFEGTSEESPAYSMDAQQTGMQPTGMGMGMQQPMGMQMYPGQGPQMQPMQPMMQQPGMQPMMQQPGMVMQQPMVMQPMMQQQMMMQPQAQAGPEKTFGIKTFCLIWWCCPCFLCMGCPMLDDK